MAQQRTLEQIAAARRPRTAEEAERAGETIWQSKDSTVARVRLWDNIDRTWTEPMEQGMVMAYTARKVVFKCTACTFTSIFEGGVARHISDVSEKYRQHSRDKHGRGASLDLIPALPGAEPSMRCTGCNDVFLTRKDIAGRHLKRVVEEGPAHKDAQEVIMRRFSLAPSTPVTNGIGPVDIQVERSRRKRSRGRRRRRNR
jgi:hypothetical protein